MDKILTECNSTAPQRTAPLILPRRGCDSTTTSRPKAITGVGRPSVVSSDKQVPACYLGSGQRKSTSVFFITMRLGSLYCPSIRSDFVDSLPTSEVYCVSMEQGNSDSCEYHLHCYIEFVDKYFLKDLHDMLFYLMCENNFNVQTVKNRKKVLTYVSKEEVS